MIYQANLDDAFSAGRFYEKGLYGGNKCTLQLGPQDKTEGVLQVGNVKVNVLNKIWLGTPRRFIDFVASIDKLSNERLQSLTKHLQSKPVHQIWDIMKAFDELQHESLRHIFQKQILEEQASTKKVKEEKVSANQQDVDTLDV